MVDETADLDAAADDVVRSAYGFQGQKCSACSRLIAVDAIHDDLVDRVVERAASLANRLSLRRMPVCRSCDLGSTASARSSPGDRERQGGGHPRHGWHVAADRDGGYYIEPTVFRRRRPRCQARPA